MYCIGIDGLAPHEKLCQSLSVSFCNGFISRNIYTLGGVKYTTKQLLCIYIILIPAETITQNCEKHLTMSRKSYVKKGDKNTVHTKNFQIV